DRSCRRRRSASEGTGKRFEPNINIAAASAAERQGTAYDVRPCARPTISSARRHSSGRARGLQWTAWTRRALAMESGAATRAWTISDSRKVTQWVATVERSQTAEIRTARQ